MSPLRVRCLGGFEVTRPTEAPGRSRAPRREPRAEFESRKVRALAALLLTNRRRVFSRDHLAGLLWPERGDDAARRNLRQALYNLRSTLETDGLTLLKVDHDSVGVHPQADYWLDRDAFEQGLHREDLDKDGDGNRREPDDRRLAEAVDLYRGPFLDGLYLKDSEAFEDWRLAEKETLQESAMDALRRLVDHHLNAGSHGQGVRHARRLLQLDPLAEDTHRRLMELYARAGRRSRALAQYDELRRILEEELGVEPTGETTELYERIRHQEVPQASQGGAETTTGPQIPMVGRGEVLEALRRIWRGVRGGGGRLTWIEGEAGIGKSRVAKSFLHEATAATEIPVLRGGCLGLVPGDPWEPFREALENALVHELDTPQGLHGASPEAVALLYQVVPTAPALVPKLPAADPARVPPTPAASVAALVELLGRFGTRSSGAPQPVILLLEDLHRASPACLELLDHLVDGLGDHHLWIVCTREDGSGEAAEGPPAGPGDREHPAVDRLRLAPLTGAETREIAAGLVGPADGERLGSFLHRASRGVPLVITELVNLLWDEALLSRSPRGDADPTVPRWLLDVPPGGALEHLVGRGPVDLADIIAGRVDRLPPSARRLLTLAVVADPAFSGEILCAAEGEHTAVVTVALRILLDRWLVRPHLGYWADSRQDRDRTLSARSLKGHFELAHGKIRETLYARLNPARRKVIHRHLAGALDRDEADPAAPGVLARHYLAAEDWDLALPLLDRAAEQAREAGAEGSAQWYGERSLEALRHLRLETGDGPGDGTDDDGAEGDGEVDGDEEGDEEGDDRDGEAAGAA